MTLPIRWTDRLRSYHELRWPLAAPYEVLQERDVNIERVWYEGENVRYFYVSHGKYRVGTFPGTASDEWIEYIPPFVEKPRPDPRFPLSTGWYRP